MTDLQEGAILVVDDEEEVTDSISLALLSGGHNNVLTCLDSRHVLSLVEETPDLRLVLLDLVMPYVKGQELLLTLRERHPDVPIVVITALDDLQTAVECMKGGAFDYLVKPVEKMRLLSTVRHAMQHLEMTRVNRALRDRLLHDTLARPEVFEAIITRNPRMLSVFQYVEAIASSPEPVLITGETGVGKELVARAIHQASGRRGGFVAVNVAGLDDNHFSDTLFGHRQGAFTGAASRRDGLVTRAAGGTLFLDEIGHLEPPSQIKLLRLLQEGEFYPLGADIPQMTDARVVAATNLDLGTMRAGRGGGSGNGRTGPGGRGAEFRLDLYYRLQTHQIDLPPLRDRREDVPLLVDHFFSKAAARLNRPTPRYPRELLAVLNCHDFPGNVRELEAMIFDAVSKNPGPIVPLDGFKARILDGGGSTDATADPARGPLPFADVPTLPTLEQAREDLVAEALRRSQGNQTVAARLLGITQPALSKWLKSRS